MKTVTILIPMYNEEAVLNQLLERLESVTENLKKYQFEFLFVNDGSRDKSLAIIKDYAEKDSRISYVDLSRNFGKEAAMLAGIDHASGDALVIIDADLQDPPELVETMLAEWEKGYDDVYARRRSREGETWLKQWTSRSYYKLLERVSGVTIQRDTGDYRLLSRRAIKALQELREVNRYTKGMFSWVGFDKKEILYDRHPRAAGETKWSYTKLFGLAVDGITSFTTAPLRIASLLGVFISLAAFVYIIVIVGRTLFFGSDLAGYPSLMAVILFLGGVQLLSLGVIGEYIARIFQETKDRPVYLIKDARTRNNAKTKKH